MSIMNVVAFSEVGHLPSTFRPFPLRTIYLGIMYMDELYQMIIFALKHYDNWKDRTHLRKVDLAPSKNISSFHFLDTFLWLLYVSQIFAHNSGQVH